MTVQGVGCDPELDNGDNRLASFLFSGQQQLHVDGDTITIRDLPEQLILHRAA